MTTLEEIRRYLASVRHRKSGPASGAIEATLARFKATAIERGDQLEAKAIWCLEQALKAQEAYRSAIEDIRAERFYHGWCGLERAEIELRFLERHRTADWDKFELGFIQDQIPKWQQLFPYRNFISPEILHVEKHCNICEQPVSLRRPCGHIVGEIYDGEMCGRTITKVELLGTALTDNPVQKYSVVFGSDPVTGNQVDNYDYTYVRYVVAASQFAFDKWDAQWTTRRQPHEFFAKVGRNDKCPCDSSLKYKKCCLKADGVMRPHLQFSFDRAPAATFPQHVFLHGGKAHAVLE